MHIRVLTANDAAAFHAVRLRALRDHPESFGSSDEHEQHMSRDQVVAIITAPTTRFFGAFSGETLVGMAAISRSSLDKMRHRASIWSMYVAPEARGTGAGRALIHAAIDYAHTLDGVEAITLAVTVGNTAAQRLYRSVGFTTFAVDPCYFRIDGRSYDLEWMILQVSS